MNRITANGDWYDGRDATEVMDGFHSEKARKMFSRLPKSDPKTVAQLEADVVPDSDIQIAFRELRDLLEADGWWERDMLLVLFTGLSMTNADGLVKTTFMDRIRMFAAVAAGLGPTWWSDKHNKHHALTNEMGVDENISN